VKRIILLMVTMITILSPLMASRWKTYTNTTHVSDFIEADNKLYLATWGGLAVFNKDPNLTGADAYTEDHVFTNIDGLTNNDVRVLDYIPEIKTLWMGLYSGGVNILTPTGLKILGISSGLPSQKITGIVHSDSLFYVSTDEGLAVFYQLANVSFPLLQHVYTTENGLINNNIMSMKLSDLGYLYLGTSNGLSYVHADSLNYPNAWHSWTLSNSNIPGSKIEQIALWNQKVAVSTNSGLGVISFGQSSHSWTVYNASNSLVSDSLYAVCYDQSGNLYYSYGAWHEDTMTLSNSTNIVLGEISASGVITEVTQESIGFDIKEISKIKVINEILVLSTWGEGIYIGSSFPWVKVKVNCIGFNSVSCISNSKDKIWFGSGVLNATKTRKGTRGVSSFDGSDWETYNVRNSPLISDNIMTISADDQDKIWMGAFYIRPNNIYGWGVGLNVFDQNTGTWDRMDTSGLYHNDGTSDNYALADGSNSLLSNSLAYIYHDSRGRMILCCYNGGVEVLDSLYDRVSAFQLPYSASQSIISVAESDSAYFFGTANDFGVSYWYGKDNLQNPSHISWLQPPSSDLRNCWVYGFISFTNDYGENEIWIAASNGLYSFNGTHWYKYDVDVKRRIYQNGGWSTDVNGLYYYDEERLFGSVHTHPTAIYLDPFRRIWIGSADYGFSMYDPSTERFTNYNTSNSPLISNRIVCLGFDERTGSLLIGTQEGLSALQIGYEEPPASKIKSVRVYPNPFRPDLGEQVTLENTNASNTFPSGKNVCKIYDLSGDLVIELKQNLFYSFNWNGLNANGKKCGSGVYYYVISTAKGDTRRGKIALIRG